MSNTSKPTAPSSPTPEGDRIAKVISRAGVASRREAEGFTFFDKCIGPRIAGADEFGVAAFLEASDGGVV